MENFQTICKLVESHVLSPYNLDKAKLLLVEFFSNLTDYLSFSTVSIIKAIADKMTVRTRKVKLSQ